MIDCAWKFEPKWSSHNWRRYRRESDNSRPDSIVRQSVDYELLNKYTETLKNIDDALERLNEVTYGICEKCGEQIGEKRLQAVPFALYCLDCQREKENLKETDYGRIWMETRAQMRMEICRLVN